MTRIEGHADDDLLEASGYSGHPTLVFMNPDGEILGRPLDRSVACFEATLRAVRDLAALEQRAADGQKVSEYDRFLLEYQLMKLRGSALEDRGNALVDLDEAQQAKVDGILLGLQVDDLVLKSLNGPDAVREAGKRMLEILDSGKCPAMESDANAWSVLARYGEQVADADLLDRCSAGLRKLFPADEGMIRWADGLAEKARGIRGKG